MVKYFRGICCEAFGKKHMTLCYDLHKKSIHIVRNGLVKKKQESARFSNEMVIHKLHQKINSFYLKNKWGARKNL